MKNTAQLVNGLHALQFTEAHVEKIMQFLISQEVKDIYADIREKENTRKQKEANDSLIQSLEKQLTEANANLAIFDIEAQIRNHPRNSSPWLGKDRDDYPLSDTVVATDGQRTFQWDRITGKAVSSTERHWGPTAPVDSYLRPEDCTEEEISEIVKAAKENLQQRGSILLEKVTPPTSSSPTTSPDVPELNLDFIEKSTIFGNIKVNMEGTSNEPSPVAESNLNESHGVDEVVDSPKCACDNPSDTNTQDCVDPGLCKDHEMDV